MEDIAAGVTPDMDSTPAADPFVQQLIAENERLRARNATLERRLALFDATIQRITVVVREAQGNKGVHG
mgnify:FL=1